MKLFVRLLRSLSRVMGSKAIRRLSRLVDWSLYLLVGMIYG
jgi:hypothetical protein